MAFVKLDQGILRSSVWDEDSDTRVVWVTLMAMADRNGFVDASLKGVAHEARVALELAEAAMTKFEGPDPHSKTPTDSGQRVLRVDGGWVLLNYGKYREKTDEATRREQVREAVRRHRERKREKAGSDGGGGVEGHAAPASDEGLDAGPPKGPPSAGVEPGAPPSLPTTEPERENRGAYLRAVSSVAVNVLSRGREELSSAEFSLIVRWYEQGIPARVVLTTLKDGKSPAPGVERQPRDLRYFEPIVAEEWARVQKALAS